MATNPKRPPPKVTPIPPPVLRQGQDAWDEEKLETALERLKELHIRLRNLRSTVPRMMQPLTGQPHSSPERMYAAYQASMTTATKEVKEFREIFTHPRTREVLDHATLSRRRNPMGITPWQPRDDPNWANLDDRPESKP